MFETLKRKMLLDESKKMSEEALTTICEEYEYDNLLAEDTLLTEDSHEDIYNPEDDATLDRILDTIPEDDAISDVVTESQLDFMEKFVTDDSYNTSFSATDLDSEGSTANASNDTEDLSLESYEDYENVATADAPSEYQSTDISESFDFLL